MDTNFRKNKIEIKFINVTYFQIEFLCSYIKIAFVKSSFNSKWILIFSYETSDGQKRDENGGFNADGVWVVQGSYSFIGDDGKEYTVNYVADDKGYRAEGDHLPKQPVLPQESNSLPLSFLKV